MGILSWIILGGFAGWLASLVMGVDKSMGVLLNILTGIVGAVIGGFVYGLFGNTGVTGFNWYSFWVAVVGAIVLIGIVKVFRK